MVRLAAALQSGSEHPLAQAVMQAAAGLALPTAHGVRAVPGRGIEGGVEGRLLRLGSQGWMTDLGVNLSALLPQSLAWQATGHSVSWLADDNAMALGVMAFGDTAKPGAAAAVAWLHGQGLRVVLLSGDNPGAAHALAAAVGIAEVHAQVLPADKARLIAELRAGDSRHPGDPVAMVGDGVNDAPALAATDVGIAMTHAGGGGTDIAMHCAGLTLLNPDPIGMAQAIHLSRAITRRIHQTLFWAFAYNAVGIPLAMLGLLSPVLAGGAMALSSVSVIASALMLGRGRPL